MFNNFLYNQIWSKLCTRSKRALMKSKKRYGHPYKYSPRSDLIINLSYELNLDNSTIANALMEMREEIKQREPERFKV